MKPYASRKPGLNDLRIAQQKAAAIAATYANKELKPEILAAMYGSKLAHTDVGGALLARMNEPKVYAGAKAFRSSGDFTGIAAVGFL